LDAKHNGSSSWEGKPLGIYVLNLNGKFVLSNAFTADLSDGRLINPNNCMGCGGPTIDPAKVDIRAIVILEARYPGWKGPERVNRPIYSSWSDKLNIPVDVRTSTNSNYFRNTRWKFENGQCHASGYSGAGEC
jgi:hypothetical protein